MSVPTTRAEFKEHCLRAIGKPVIEINVDDDQVEDRIDEALRFYWDYHFDGTEKIYYKQIITANIVSDGYFTLPENIIGVVKVFDIDDPSFNSSDIFSIRYQIALNDLYTLTSVSLVPYYMTMEHMALIQELLVGKTMYRYNRHRDRIYIDKDKGRLQIGRYFLLEVAEVVDPEVWPDVWADWWLQNYVQQLIKRQWGANLSKFTGLQLPGGVQFDGQKIYDDADREIKELRERMINDYSLPVTDMVG